MRLWRRASGLLKDRNRLWIVSFLRRTSVRNPDIEAAVIKSTNHDETSFDMLNIDRLYQWIRLSPANFRPFLWSLSNRMQRTKSWAVAVKGLYLMHNVTNCMVSCVKEIGRLPFDLSNFKDGHFSQSKAWPYDEFIRSYYAFLDQKSTFIFQHLGEKRERMTIKQELGLLQKLQALIDLLMQIKPQSRATRAPLVLKAMDGIVLEIFDIYSRICRGIAIVIMNIYSAGMAEAVVALHIVQKATLQGEELKSYFEFCQEIGVVNASKFPFVDRVPEEGIQELEHIINGFSTNEDECISGQEEEEDKAVVVGRVESKVFDNNEDKDCLRNELKTIITDNWEKFEEGLVQNSPFAGPLMTRLHGKSKQNVPDLISF